MHTQKQPVLTRLSVTLEKHQISWQIKLCPSKTKLKKKKMNCTNTNSSKCKAVDVVWCPKVCSLMWAVCILPAEMK